MIYERHLRPNDIRRNQTLVPLDDLPWRQYRNTTGTFNALAQEASQRQAGETLLCNIYAIVADYFLQAVWQDTPEGLPREVSDAFQKATFYRALYGYGIVVRQGGTYSAIDPRHWWPVLVRGIKVGSAVVQPYSIQSGVMHQNHIPDRAWTLTAIDAVQRGVIRDFQYNGITLGNQVRREEVTDMQVAVFGDGDRDFQKVEALTEELDARLKGNGRILKRFSQPHLQVPASAIRYGHDGTPSLVLSEDGSVLPVQRDDKDYKYLALTADPRLTEFHIRLIISLIATATAVPASHFQQHGLPRLESGTGVNAIQGASAAKVDRWRHQIEDALAFLNIPATWPDRYQTQATPNGEENPNDTGQQGQNR